MAAQDGQEGGRASSQGSRVRPGNRRAAQWMRDYARLPGIPDEYIAQDGTPRPVWSRFFDAFAALSPGEIERRFGSADRHLREAGVTYPRARRNRRAAVAAEPPAASDRRRRLAAIERGHRAACAIAGTGAGRPLRRGPAGRRRRHSRRRDCRQPRISARGLRHQASGRPLSRFVCRRCRPWSRTGAGGCWATVPRRPRAPATRWKTASCCRAPSPRSTSR